MIRAVIWLPILMFMSACTPTLYLASPPPPNRMARVNQRDGVVEISEGVAVAIQCNREGMPCKDVQATSADPHVARVFPAHLAEVYGGHMEQDNVSALALAGISPGTTTLRVTSAGWTSEYVVTVVRAPVAKTALK